MQALAHLTFSPHCCAFGIRHYTIGIYRKLYMNAMAVG